MSSVDKLKLYFGDDLYINEYITVHNPTIDDVIEIGEEEYFSMVYSFCAIPSDMKSDLWDAGVDWMEISDFEFFYAITKSLPVKSTKVLFGDLDFTKFEFGTNMKNDEPILYQPVLSDDGEEIIDYIIIDRHIYLKMIEFVRGVHRITPKVEKAVNKTTKRILVDEDRAKKLVNKDKPFETILLPLVSSMINCAEFKYGLNEVRNMPLYAFMDSVARIQVIKSADALLHGAYGGMIDTSKINKSEFNWMKDI